MKGKGPRLKARDAVDPGRVDAGNGSTLRVGPNWGPCWTAKLPRPTQTEPQFVCKNFDRWMRERTGTEPAVPMR